MTSHRLARSDLGPSRDSIPYANRLVVGSCRQRVAVRTPCQATHTCHVANEGIHMTACRGIPQAHRRIGRRRRNVPAVGRYANLGDRFRVAMQRKPRPIIGFRGTMGRRSFWGVDGGVL